MLVKQIENAYSRPSAERVNNLRAVTCCRRSPTLSSHCALYLSRRGTSVPPREYPLISSWDVAGLY